MQHDHEAGGSTASPRASPPLLKPTVAKAKDEDIRRELDARLRVMEAAMRHDLEEPDEQKAEAEVPTK